jgi:hypothetical protein
LTVCQATEASNGIKTHYAIRYIAHNAAIEVFQTYGNDACTDRTVRVDGMGYFIRQRWPLQIKVGGFPMFCTIGASLADGANDGLVQVPATILQTINNTDPIMSTYFIVSFQHFA